MRIKLLPVILFFIVYFWAYAIFNAINAKADEPTITVPYTEEQMCRALLKAEICEMSREEQEKYFLEIFRAFIDQTLDESFNKKKEETDICLEMVGRKLVPCREGLDI